MPYRGQGNEEHENKEQDNKESEEQQRSQCASRAEAKQLY